jgi:hypothetical protein
MEIAVSTYYYNAKPRADEGWIVSQIEDVLTKLGPTGYIAMTAILRRTTQIGDKKVYRIMRLFLHKAVRILKRVDG